MKQERARVQYYADRARDSMNGTHQHGFLAHEQFGALFHICSGSKSFVPLLPVVGNDGQEKGINSLRSKEGNRDNTSILGCQGFIRRRCIAEGAQDTRFQGRVFFAKSTEEMKERMNETRVRCSNIRL